jgi:5,10-methylenetetrahydromethanopterin reductase
MQAAALDELAGGRFNLGIAAGAGEFLGWVGIAQERPLAVTADAIRVLRSLFAGERPQQAGWTSEAYMRFATRPIPIYLGAMSPRMHRLIGEVADGGLPLLFPPERYAAVADRVRAGAQAAGRDPSAIDLAACVWVSVASDRRAAADALRAKVAYYGNAFSEEVLGQIGLERGAFAEINRLVQELNAPERAATLVTDQMLRVGIVGTGAQVRERLEGVAALGARHLSFGPPLGPEPLQALRILGREVLPALRDG